MNLNFWSSLAAAQKASGAKAGKVTHAHQLMFIVLGALLAVLAVAGFISLILSDYH